MVAFALRVQGLWFVSSGASVLRIIPRDVNLCRQTRLRPLIWSIDYLGNAKPWRLWSHCVAMKQNHQLFEMFLSICSSFLAGGLTVPVAVSACAASLRRVCEDVPNLSQEPSNVAGLLHIGEVIPWLERDFKKIRLRLLISWLCSHNCWTRQLEAPKHSLTLSGGILLLWIWEDLHYCTGNVMISC